MANWILKFIKPFVVWLGNLKFPWTRRLLSSKHYFWCLENLEDGDAILINKKWEPSNLINPSKMKHVEIYVKEGTVSYAWGAVGEGVRRVHLVDLVMGGDRIVICRPNFLKAVDSKNISDLCKDFDDHQYDYMFNKGNKDKKVYCFEFLALAYKRLAPDIDLRFKTILGKKVFDYKTFKDKKYFDVLYDSKHR